MRRDHRGREPFIFEIAYREYVQAVAGQEACRFHTADRPQFSLHLDIHRRT